MAQLVESQRRKTCLFPKAVPPAIEVRGVVETADVRAADRSILRLREGLAKRIQAFCLQLLPGSQVLFG